MKKIFVLLLVIIALLSGCDFFMTMHTIRVTVEGSGTANIYLNTKYFDKESLPFAGSVSVADNNYGWGDYKFSVVAESSSDFTIFIYDEGSLIHSETTNYIYYRGGE